MNEYSEKIKENLEPGSKVFAITFGCQQNEADTEKLLGMATEMGYALTDKKEEANLILVNTCAIREHAEQKVFSYLGNLKILKEQQPDLLIAVCGCMTAQEHRVDYLKKSFPYVSFTLDPSSIAAFPETLWTYLTKHKRTFVKGEICPPIVEGIPLVRKDTIKAWVSIMYGCNNFCSYCIVPYVRGRERSRESKEILEEVRCLVAKGYKEITLLGQNVNSYKGDCNFAELLRKTAEIEGDFIIRFMTSHPKDVSDELIQVMQEYKGKIAPHFHLPLQSGSDTILKRMNRHYDSTRYKETVRKLKEHIPDIAITTDIIIGFPGETDADFQATMDMIELVRYDSIYAFLYSRRKGTPADQMEDQVPEDVRKVRMATLISKQEQITRELAQQYLGKTMRVLVDHVENGVAEGRTGSFRQVVFPGEQDLLGTFVWVQIEEANSAILHGKKID